MGLLFAQLLLTVVTFGFDSSAQKEAAKEQGLIDAWSQVKAGDCLAQEQLQALSGVVDTNLYKGQVCGSEYVVDSDLVIDDESLCSEPVLVGRWEREVVEHKKAGFFWPSKVPCEASVKALYLEYKETENLSCQPEGEVVFYQEEIWQTKRYSAGQGELHLPSPFRLTRYEAFNRSTQCRELNLRMNYLGWGDLSAGVQIFDCLNEAEGQPVELFCRRASLTNSKTSDGNSCLKVKKIEACD